MSLTLFALLLCSPSAHAQGSGGYPGGGSGSGYPGGGSGSGPAPDPGHYWKITYSNTNGKTTWAIPDSPFFGLSTAQEYDWTSQANGDGLESETYLDTKSTGTVTATLTWIPAAGKSLQSDPPSKMVSIEEYGTAEESPANWNGFGPAPVPAGSASNGLGDTPMAWNSGYISTGTHRVRKDGTSGTITLGPFTLTAICPVSNWVVDPEFCEEFPPLSYEYYHWDWMGGLSAAGFSVKVVPPAYPINFRCTNASTGFDGVLHHDYAWDSSTGNLSDLDGCTIKERVSYEGNSTGYYSTDVHGTPCYVLPLPFEGVFADPEIYGGTPGTVGYEGDDQLVPRIPGPYQPGSYTSTQYFIYK